METNVVGFGWSLQPAPTIAELIGDDVSDDDPLKVKAEAEWEYFDEFLNYGNYDNGSLTQLRRNQVFDLESTGMKFLEIIVSAKGKPVGFRHAPSFRMRLSKTDDEPTIYKEIRIVGRGKNRRTIQATKLRRFRRFAQLEQRGNDLKVTWFKEWGDPRRILRETGEVVPAEVGDDQIKPGMLANPMIYRRLYAPMTPYGIPRYMGNLLSILGSRAAEEINYTTFKNNNVPSMFVLVSGGQLTAGSLQRLQEFSHNIIQGDDNRSRFVLIEAEPDPVVGDQGSGQVRIEIEKLNEVQTDDAMFVEYEKANTDKVRGSWRITPIQVGEIASFTKSSSETARKMTEEQVFEPDRREDDYDWNQLLFSTGMKFHEFKTNSPNVTNDENLIAVLAAAERSGAMTPRLARIIVREVLNRELPRIDENEVPLDVPFSATMAELVKNLARPNEVGQQVTALKSDTIGDIIALTKLEIAKQLAGASDSVPDVKPPEGE